MSSDLTYLSSRHLQDQTNGLNSIPSSGKFSTGPKARKAFKKLANRATKAIDRHLHLSEAPAVSTQSPPQKRMTRVSAQRAAMKTAEYAPKLTIPPNSTQRGPLIVSDFRGMGILDSQVDSQAWYDNLVREEMSPAPDSEGEAHGCTHCDALRAELQRAHNAHLETINDSFHLARDYDRLVAQLQELREAVADAGAKLSESAGVAVKTIFDNGFEG